MQKTRPNKKIILYILATIILLAFLITFISIGEDIMYNKIYDIDTYFYNLALSMRTKPLTFIFKMITNFCNPITIGIISIILMFTLKNKKKLIFALFLNLGMTALLNLSLKYIFARSRPDIAFQLVQETGYSFPSGHAMFSLTFYGFIIYTIIKSNFKKSTKAISSILLSLLVLLICFSRIYLGVHYFSDVLGGILISIVYLTIFLFIFERNSFKYNDPNTEYKRHSFLSGFKYAFNGILSCLKDENNLLIEFAGGMLVVMFAVFLKCTFVEWSILIIMCFLVVAFEMVNTALENLSDKVTTENDEQLKKVKDIASGAVLTMSICAVIVAGVIFIPKIPILFKIFTLI